MTEASQPVKKDTAPPEFVKMAEDFIYGQAEHDEGLKALLTEQGCFGNFPLNTHIPSEWLDVLAQEFDAAISDRGGEWVETLIAGRPYDTPLVEWEHRELVDIDDAKEIAANQRHRW